MNAVYCIVQKDAGWFVRLNGKEFGPYPSLEAVAKPTMRAAAKAHARGCHAHVMVYEDNRFRTLWINGSLEIQQAA